MVSKNLNIVVVVPSGITWFAEFATSLISMSGYFMTHKVPGWDTHKFRVTNVRGSILPTLRLNGLKAAKEVEATHLLFIDSDHTFPPDTLHQLLKWNKDCVAANCVTKTIPAMTTARTFNPEDSQGDVVYSDPQGPTTNALQKVWRVGTGVMLLSARAYLQIPHSAFAMPYMPVPDVYQGEDWSMCEALESAGVPIYVDHRLSREVGHVGVFNFNHDYVGTLQYDEEIIT
jgi:hypothetical protein